VPINVAKSVASQLLTTGRVERVILGVSYNDVDPEMAEAFRLPVSRASWSKAFPTVRPRPRPA
jgi:S1-C subfamily serine protease